MRFLPKPYIPKVLLKENTIHISQLLVDSYIKELNKLELYQKSIAGTKNKDIHGGASKNDTYEHFAYRFSNSASRMVAALLATDDRLVEISDSLLSIFTEGRISILDIPCGTGAASCALLSTLYSLRESKALPKLPLSVDVVGGDYSSDALDVHRSLLKSIASELCSSGIFIHDCHFEDWNAKQSDSTAKLVDKWFQLSPNADYYVVCIANFSGALIDTKEAIEEILPNIEFVMARLHNKRCVFIWLEPVRGKKTLKIAQWIKNYCKKRLAWFFGKNLPPENYPFSHYKTKDPINGRIHSSHVEVKQYRKLT